MEIYIDGFKKIMNRDTVLAFVHLFKPHIGGLEKYTEEFYTHLPYKNIIIITSKYQKNLEDSEACGNLRIIRIPCIEIVKGKYFIPTIKGVKQISKIIKESYNAEVHTHTRFYLLNFIAVIFAKRYNKVHFHFEHGASFVKDGSLFVRSFAYLFDRTLARVILKNAKLIFPVSKSVKDFLSENFSNLQFGPIIYFSFDFNSKNFILRKKPKILKLLFVGRLIKTKGIYELIEACKILKGNSYTYSLSIIGDGSERKNIEGLIKDWGLQGDILLKGQLSFDNTQLEYKKHDILINPSHTEGFGLTVLEGLANNQLVIATNAGGIKEIIPESELIPIGRLSARSIVKKVIHYHEDWSNKQKQFQKIFELAKDTFSYEKIIKSYITSIQEK